MKACTLCKVEKPLSAFRMRGGKRGPRLTSECIPCNLERQRRIRNGDDQGQPWKRSPEEVAANNACILWHGPVRREPMRWAA